MFAKQTIVSASFVVALAGASGFAHAEEPDERPKTGTFQVGAGFSSIEGFVAAARIEQSSLFGTGHMLALDARISRMRQDFGLLYSTPDLGNGLSVSAELFNRQRQLPAFNRIGAGGAFTLQQRFSPNVRAFIGYRYEQVTSPISARLTSVTTGLVYESEATTIGMAYEVSDHRLGSDFNFDRINGWIRHHEPIGPLTLHLGASMTRLMGDVPQSERLFIDGWTDVRGFRAGAFAPLGGTSKWSARAELEVPLIRRIGLSAVGFADAGGIDDSGFSRAGTSVGVGLSWRSPIGPLRFDWAVPLGGGEPRFLFGIGADW